MVGALKQRPERAPLRTQPGKMVQMHHKVGGWDAGPLKQREQAGFKTETWGQKRQEGPDR